MGLYTVERADAHKVKCKMFFLAFLSIFCFGDTVDYYSSAMLGLKTDQEVLGELVKVKAPAVGQLMDQYPGIWTLVVSRWFICLYIDILPIEVRKSWVLLTNEVYICIISQTSSRFQTVLRVWDCLFYEGSKVLFRVALTLIIHHQPEILRARSLPDVCECFRQITCGAFTLECHTFMQVRQEIAIKSTENWDLIYI